MHVDVIKAKLLLCIDLIYVYLRNCLRLLVAMKLVFAMQLIE